MILQKILKRYEPYEILDLLSMEEIDYRAAVVLHKDRKKVLIANNVKVISYLLNPDLEVLICNSATQFGPYTVFNENLKVIHCPLVKQLPHPWSLPSSLEYIVLNSLTDEEGFFHSEHFSEYSFLNVKKLYLDSIKKIDLSRFPNVEYLSLNSIQDFENSGISNKDELPVSLKFLSPLTLKKHRHLQKHL